jgi:hypothetical protein
MTETMSRQAALAIGILAPYVKSKLAFDQSIDLRPLFTGVTARTWDEDKCKILKGIQRACKGRLARDASIGSVAELLDLISDVVTEDEAVEQGVHNTMIKTARVKAKDGSWGNRASERSESEFNGSQDDVVSSVEEFLKGKLLDEEIEQVCELLRGNSNDNYDEDLDDDSDDREEENNPDRDPNEDDEIDRSRETSPNEYQRQIRKAVDNPPNMRRAGRDEPPPFKGRPKVGGGMDAAMRRDLNRIGILPMERQQPHLDNFGRLSDGRLPAKRPKAQIAMDAKARSRSQKSFVERFPDCAKVGRAM